MVNTVDRIQHSRVMAVFLLAWLQKCTYVRFIRSSLKPALSAAFFNTRQLTKFLSKPMKLDLLFLVITHMLCWHPHQSFIIGLFSSHDPLVHEYQYSRRGSSAYSCLANHSQLLNCHVQNQTRSQLVGSYTNTFFRLLSKLEDLLFCTVCFWIFDNMNGNNE